MTNPSAGFGLQVRLTLSAREVLTGEGFKAKVELHNGGPNPLRLVAPTGVTAPPLQYEFSTAPDGEAAFTLSRQQYYDFLAGDDFVPGEEPTFIDLPPGQAVSTEEEPGQYAVGGIDPGQYWVRARWTQENLGAVSEPVELRVSAPAPQHLASLLCPSSEHVNAILAEPGPAGTTLLERNIDEPRPEGAVFARVHFVAAPSEVTDVAASVHTETALRGRWHAWLQHSEVFAAHTWGSAVIAKPPPLASTIAAPKLARPVVHWPDGSASWVVFGADDRGELVAQGGMAEARRMRGAAAVSLGTSATSEVKTRAFLATRAVALFWVAKDGTWSSLNAAVLDHAGQLKAPLRSLFRTDSQVLAWNLCAIGPISNAVVHVLCGPDNDGALSYVAVPWNDEIAQTTVPRVVEPSAPVQPSAWAISAPLEVEDGNARPVWLAANVGGQLLGTTVARPSWTSLVDPLGATPTNLHFLSGERDDWLGWMQPGEGLRFVQLR
jgi:hypothetical protein